MQRDLIPPRIKNKRFLFGVAALFFIGLIIILLSTILVRNLNLSQISSFFKPKYFASLEMTSAGGKLIEFRTYNGEESKNHRVEIRQIPHLVLLRNGELTSPDERSLSVVLRDFKLPGSAEAIDIIVETQNGDPDAGGGAMNRIQVKKSRINLDANDKARDQLRGLSFSYILGSKSEQEPADLESTPSGYYRVAVRAVETKNGEERSIPLYDQDYAFLLESQWVVDLPLEIGVPAGAGPRQLVIYYTDMTPFQSDTFTVEGRLPRQAVNSYIETIVAPGMLAIIKQEAINWRFPWSSAWRGYRPGEDYQRISVALTDQKEWFHGRAPKGGFATLSINVHQFDLQTYVDVTDWIYSIFSHELFHNVQRNMNLLNNGDGEPEGSQHAWKVVTEGTALLIESLMRSYFGTLSNNGNDPYLARLRTYLTGSMPNSSNLNTSITQLSPYEMVVYWRFLYNNCQPAIGESDNFDQGLGIIRQTLETLYTDHEILDDSLDNVPLDFAKLMDRVFANSQLCKYTTYRESLASFARSLYALRYEEQDCSGMNEAGECLEEATTPAPPAIELVYTGEPLTIEDRISSSYGMDFYEISLPDVDPEAVQLDFICLTGDVAAYQVELITLSSQIQVGDALVPSRLSREAAAGVPIRATTPYPEDENITKLGVVITRVDPNENADPIGGYRLTIAIDN